MYIYKRRIISSIDFVNPKRKKYIYTVPGESLILIMAEKKKGSEKSLDYALLQKLIVGIGEVSEITGVPIRKLRYWEEKEIIRSTTDQSGKTRRYDIENIKKIIMISELLEEGYTLDAAAVKVEKRLIKIDSLLLRFIEEK